jgi:hypothetical protein
MSYPDNATGTAMLLEWLDGSVTEDTVDWPNWFTTAPQIRDVEFARTGADTYKTFPSRFTTTSGRKFVSEPCRAGDEPGTVRYKETA